MNLQWRNENTIIRQRALAALLADSTYRPRQVSGRLVSLLVWREGGRLPPLHVLGANITDLQLTRQPIAERRSLGKCRQSFFIYLQNILRILYINGCI